MNPDLDTNDDLDTDADAGSDKTPGEHLADGCRKACMAILADDSLSAREKADKIKAYLLAHEKLAGDADAEDDEEEEDDDDLDDLTKKKKGKDDAATEAVKLLLKLGKGKRRLKEHRGARRPGRITVESFKARWFRR